MSKPPKETHTSQTSSFSNVILSSDIPTGSNRFRSVNDPSLAEASRNPIRYRLQDTPGHGKLRSSQGMSILQARSNPKDVKGNIRGVIFMVDASTLLESDESLRDAATYLYDVLMGLQKRLYKDGKRTSHRISYIPVLVAANKQDLFTSLPENLVKGKLESEIEKLRQSKRKGLLDASVNTQAGDDELELLGGEESQEKFSFHMLEEETGVKVDVVGSSVKSEENADYGKGIRPIEEWIGMRL